jgi:hypothetical protein
MMTGAGWLMKSTVHSMWPESLGIDDLLLEELIETAREQCEAYAPALEPGEPVPSRYRTAQLMQIQGLWKSSTSGPGDSIGPEGLTITVFPMDRTVKNALRPKRGIPVVG